MAHIAQIKILEDEGEKLSAILEYVRDPKAFVEGVKADVKSVYGLTEDEKQKAAEARSLIAEHQTILDGMKAANATHEANKAEIAAREASLIKATNKFSADVASANTEHWKNVDALEQAKKDFAQEVKDKNKALDTARDDLGKQTRAFENDKIAHKKEIARVAGIEQAAAALKAKYEKKLAVIQSDAE